MAAADRRALLGTEACSHALGRAPGPLAGRSWGSQRVQLWSEDSATRPQNCLGNVGSVGKGPDWFAECGAEFVARAAPGFRGDAGGRLPLLAGNVSLGLG